MKKHRSFVKIGVVLLLLIILGASPATAQPSSSEAPPLIKHAESLIDSWRGQGDALEQARADIDTVLAKDPQNIFALVQQARYYMKRNYSHEENISNGHGKIGSIGVFQPGTLELCEGILLKALKINPKFADGYVLLGHVYMQEKKFDQALAALQKAQALGTNNPWLHVNWAAILFLQGDEEGSIDHNMQVINSGTTNMNALRTARSSPLVYYIGRKEYEKADALYIKMINLDPSDAWFIGNYAIFLRTRIGNFDKALEYAQKSLQVLNNGVAQRVLVQCLYAKWGDMITNNKGDKAEAQKLFDVAYKMIPDLDFIMSEAGSYAAEKPLVLALQARGVSINAKAAHETSSRSSALNTAANTGRTDAVEMLLSLGADPNIMEDSGWTPLLGAADEGHADIVKLLLEHGADIHQTIRGKDAAMLAESRGYTEITQMIRQYAKAHPTAGSKGPG